ncbi:hypothetical protein [Dokdonella koreensis]|uniref:Uncharacterized protein n=1 Tax=Dokdonella koreensis DS-123 TaxID=1300342 RepID=A0A167G791_9GAMM|nr:hypothetical protein [Dokdonella koreensis]ANB16224.1 Hypothetical protein I596_185 [Dokdonella koreensis DS-123]
MNFPLPGVRITVIHGSPFMLLVVVATYGQEIREIEMKGGHARVAEGRRKKRAGNAREITLGLRLPPWARPRTRLQRRPPSGEPRDHAGT